ncbi:ChaN family lipoprotein [Pseudomonas rubra]|uniref:ChaN family lipoprotein n=1 Tax=Pseudomonas rubra TaxID=2942627 RepID=A0ABT5P556_9PSED|nr:ChaN family lipoprotein [Pseudomonas rubra]MDD1013423.1 ChaN family lipoprotein [Pseudomonas rubra]MDD1040458.1 ChaN family lipoprotein [Pseudomonas rubra]MDD1155063.1 ChaN family lipoprotein [Pseudomonas rubra]
MFKSSFVGLGLALLVGCTSVNTPVADSAYTRVEAHIPQWGAIIELGSGRQISPDQLLDELAPARTVMVGELHDNVAHHLIEQWLASQLAKRRPQGAVVLEMLDSDQQRPVTDVQAWLGQGNQVRSQRLQQIIHWDPRWSWEQYGTLMQALMPAQAALLAGNLSAAERKRMMAAPVDNPDRLFPSPAIAARQRQHISDMHCGQIDSARMSAMLAIQHARDLRMAQVLDDAKAPGLLFAGVLHTLKSLGAPQYLAQGAHDPGLKVLVIGEQGHGLTARDADYVWLLPAQDADGVALVAGAGGCDQPAH